MATAQQLIDAKYSNQLAINDQNLKSIFGETLIGWGRKNDCVSYEDFKLKTGDLDLSDKGLKTLKGLEYLTSLTSLYLNNNSLTDIGSVSGLTALTYLRLDNNSLTVAMVDAKLSQCRDAYDGGAPFSSGIQLQGNAIPTGGVSNADYVYLTEQGISVTIDNS